MKKIIFGIFIISITLGFNVHAKDKQRDLCLEELEESLDFLDAMQSEEFCEFRFLPVPKKGNAFCSCGGCKTGEICKHYSVNNGAACRCVPAPIVNPCPHGCGPGQPQPPA